MKKEMQSTYVLCVVKMCLVVLSSIAITNFGLTPLASFMTDGLHAYATCTQPSDGYTLFAPMRSTTTYMIDNSGEVIHTWGSDYRPALSVYLLENGTILRTAFPGLPANSSFTSGGGCGGLIQKIDWDGTVTWEYEYSNNQHLLHHDIEPLPNGNILMIAWEYKSSEEAITAGRDPSLLLYGELWPDHIIEVEPYGSTGGNITWEWHVWDHLIQDFDPLAENYGNVAAHPELIDINVYGTLSADWNHINSIDYNQELDQILLSVNGFREIWVIDHNTTIEEAASHTGGNSGKGGDILYRWGNPQTYRVGDANDQKFYQQHDAQWVRSGVPGEGNILVFNNGNNRPSGSYSSVDEIVPPISANGSYLIEPGSAYEPEEQVWIYTAEPPIDLYSTSISGAQRLPNGNTLICNGQAGLFLEVTPEKEIIWEFLNTFPNERTNNVFKTYRYGQDFPGLLDLLCPNDVAISNVTANKTTVIQGEELIINVEAENQGIYTETFNVTAYVNATDIWEETVDNLESGENQLLSFVWNTSNFTGGNYSLSVTADIVVNETDILDNVYIYGSLRLLSHDLTITNATVLKTIVGQSYSTYVNATIRNQGDFDEIFSSGLNVTTTIIGLVTNITLFSQSSASVSFEWNTTGYAKGNYSLNVYVFPVNGEINIEDNMFVLCVLVTITGDVDGNRDVNIFDIVMIAGSYGTAAGDPGYSPNCDIDGNNKIDIFDVVLAAGNYGMNW